MTESDAGPAPRANPNLIGHKAVETLLARAFRSGKLAHAWMLTGPRGVGKATLAWRFARHVLAHGGPRASLPEADSLFLDPAHPVFRRVAGGGHADVLTVERTADPRRNPSRIRAQIVVDDARRLRDFFSLAPAEGGWRVAVIDAADEMNRNAANAVLKIVEEPPPQALLLLIAHVPGRIPATLRSRCRKLALTPLPEDGVTEFLAAVRPGLDSNDRRLLAALADGAPGRAAMFADRGALELYRDMTGLIASAPDIDPAALHSFADGLARRGAEADFRIVADLLARWVARRTTAGARGHMPDSLPPTREGRGQRLPAPPSLDRWAALWEKINTLAAQADRLNLDRKQVILDIFLALETTARA